MPDALEQGAWKLAGKNLKVGRDEFSALSSAVFLSRKNIGANACPAFKVENSAKVLSC